ncbi:nucleotide exchange factor GrpE [Gemmatimonadota bacterium]
MVRKTAAAGDGDKGSEVDSSESPEGLREEALEHGAAGGDPQGIPQGPDEVPTEESEEYPDPTGADGPQGEGPSGTGEEEVPSDREGRGGTSRDAEAVEALQTEIDALRDQHLRLAADFENYRKRVNADLASSWVRAQAELARSLLDGLDDLQRVSQFTSEDTTVEALMEGVDLVERKLFRALAEAGMEALDPVGEPFDPNTMEAMMRVPTEEDDQDETVHDVFQRGYLFKDLLVRPARVSVYKDDD